MEQELKIDNRMSKFVNFTFLRTKSIILIQSSKASHCSPSDKIIMNLKRWDG
jgi:hypothetical protein